MNEIVQKDRDAPNLVDRQSNAGDGPSVSIDRIKRRNSLLRKEDGKEDGEKDGE